MTSGAPDPSALERMERNAVLCACLGWLGSVLVLCAALPFFGPTFTGEVTAYVLAAVVAPALLVLGDPLGHLVAALQPSARRRAVRLFASRPTRVLSSPVAALVVWLAVPWVSWTTGLHEFVDRYPAVRLATLAVGGTAGFVFVSAVLGIGPLARRWPAVAVVLAVAATLPAHGLFGLVMLAADHPIAGHTVATSDTAATILDQQRAGVVAWVAGDVMAMVLLVVAVPRWVASAACEHGRARGRGRLSPSGRR